MSNYLTRSFSFDKDFKKVNYVVASSNVRPLSYSKHSVERSEEETSFEFVRRHIEYILDNTMHLSNKSHYINFLIDKFLGGKEVRTTWYSIYDFNGYKKVDDKGDWHINFDSEKDSINYYREVTRVENLKDAITKAVLKDEYRDEYKALRKEKYYLRSCSIHGAYIYSVGKRGYRYTFNKDLKGVRVYNGIEAKLLYKGSEIFYFEKVVENDI